MVISRYLHVGLCTALLLFLESKALTPPIEKGGIDTNRENNTLQQLEEQFEEFQELFTVQTDPAPEPVAEPQPSGTNRFPIKLGYLSFLGGSQPCCSPLTTNYFTFMLLLAPHYKPGSPLFMGDLRGHYLQHGNLAGNAGIVTRFVPRTPCHFPYLFGFNLYYDFEQGCLGVYHQMSFGLELLGRRWDLRANFAIPFHGQRTKTCIFDDYIGPYVVTETLHEFTSYTINAEVGVNLLDPATHNFWLYLAGGPYYMSGRTCLDTNLGLEVRLKPQYKDFVALDIIYQYDSFSNSMWQAELYFYFPLYRIKAQNARPCGLIDWQIYQPVERLQTIPLRLRSCYIANY